DVKIGLVRDSATGETPKSQNEQFSLAEPTVHLLELARGRGSEGIQSAFGYPGIAKCHFEGIAAAVDELDPERKAPLVDHTPRAIECDVIGVAAHRGGEAFRKFL